MSKKNFKFADFRGLPFTRHLGENEPWFFYCNSCKTAQRVTLALPGTCLLCLRAAQNNAHKIARVVYGSELLLLLLPTVLNGRKKKILYSNNLINPVVPFNTHRDLILKYSSTRINTVCLIDRLKSVEWAGIV